jgi:predicted RNA-binding protein YlxR (DUF448 family)
MGLAAASRARRCIVTGDEPGEAELLRFALGPAGVVVADVGAKLPGRGAWVRASREHVEQAARKNAFSRAFQTKAEAPADLADQAEAALARRCLAVLGLGRKAGALAAGFDQVEAAFRDGRPWALIEAADGAADGREKLVRLAYGLWGECPPLVGCFAAAELGMALGRDRVVHATWLQERMARLWAVETGRLSGFRALAPESWRLASRPIVDPGPGRGGDAA